MTTETFANRNRMADASAKLFGSVLTAILVTMLILNALTY